MDKEAPFIPIIPALRDGKVVYAPLPRWRIEELGRKYGDLDEFGFEGDEEEFERGDE